MQIVYNSKESQKEKSQEYEVTCMHCKSKIKCSIDETIVGPRGWRYFQCPVCGFMSLAEEMPNFNITADKLEFPQHYWRIDSTLEKDSFGNRPAIDLSEDRINELVKSAIKYINEKNDFGYSATGDTFVVAYKTGELDEFRNEEVEIVIAKNYWLGSYKYNQFDKN